jgi:protein O-GlcNAc transferase
MSKRKAAKPPRPAVEDADARFARAMELHRGGDIAGASRLYAQILESHPRHANAMHFLGLAHQQGERLDQAAKLMEESIALAPRVAAFYGNYANLCAASGEFGKAEEAWRRMSLLDPQNPLPLVQAGQLALRRDALPAASQALRSAAARSPGNPTLLREIGVLQWKAGLLDDALATSESLVNLVPRDAEALGLLAAVLFQMGSFDDAVLIYRRAIAEAPRELAARNNLGLAYTESRRYALAEDAFQGAITVDPAFASAYFNLAIVQHMCGDQESADASLRIALQLDPNYLKAAQGRLFLKNSSDAISAEQLAAEHRRFGDLFDSSQAGSGAADFRPAAFGVRPDTERRLRIGFVSGDLRRHPVGFFLQAIFAHLPESRSEVFCYATAPGSDELTRDLIARADAWRECWRLDDAAFVARIRADEIDILIDLAGHTRSNRLRMFSHRPAPVQATYLGYCNTTGMPSIGWRITDAQADPPELESLSTERLLRLPDSYYCYRPQPDAPAVAPLPAMSKGHVTFGCCLNLGKASATTLALWASVLRATPGSRLLLQAAALGEPAVCRRLVDRFGGLGIDAARVELRPYAPFPRHFDTYAEIDIGLDTTPFNLATNLVEGLWQGVPFVSLIGDRSPARMGYSLLSAAGMPELAAPTAADFVRIATELARSDAIAALAARRAGMRARLVASPLLDGAAKAAALEAAYRHMWREYCRSA